MTQILLPPQGDFTDANTTEGEYKVAQDSLVEFLSNTLGTVSGTAGEGYLALAKGTTVSQPAITSDGWLRFNTDRNKFEISNLTSTNWDELLCGTVNGTWANNIEVDQTGALRVISSTTDCESAIESTSGSVTVGVNATERYIKCTGTEPLKIYIDGVGVMKLDASGNLTVIGTITQQGTV